MNDNKDENAEKLKEESHTLFDNNTSLVANGLGIAAGIMMPGGIITKAVASYIFTNIFDKVGDAITNSAIIKDEDGNPIKDNNGNVQYRDTAFGNVIKWVDNDNHFWNDSNNPKSTIAAIASIPVIGKMLGNIPSLSLTKEGTLLAKASRFGIRGLAALMVGGLMKWAFSDNQSTANNNQSNNSNQSNNTSSSSIFSFLPNIGISDLFFSKASAASLDNYPTQANKITQTNENAQVNETAVLGTTEVIDQPEQEQASLLETLAISTGIGTTAAFTYNFITGLNKPLSEINVPREKWTSPITRIGEALKHIINIFISMIGDIKNMIGNLFEAVTKLPEIISNKSASLFYDTRTYLGKIPSSMQYTFSTKTSAKWALAKHMIDTEDKLAHINKALTTAEEDSLTQTPVTRTQLLAQQEKLQADLENSNKTMKYYRTYKWLPEYKSTKYQRLFDTKFKNFDFYDQYNQRRLNELNTKLNNTNNSHNMTRTQIKNIDKLLSTTTDTSEKAKLQLQKAAKILFEKYFSILATVQSDQISKLVDNNKSELEKIIGSKLTDAEFENINKTIIENKGKEQQITKLKTANSFLDTEIQSLRNASIKLDPGTQSNKFNEITKLIDKATEQMQKHNKEINELEKAIEDNKIKIGRQIENANSFFRTLIRNGFDTTRNAIKGTSQVLGKAITGMFESTKISIITTAKDMLQFIGSIFNLNTNQILETIGKATEFVLKPFKSLFKSIRTIAKFLGIGEAATEAGKGLAEASKGASFFERMKAQLFKMFPFLEHLPTWIVEKVTGAAKALGKVAAPLEIINLAYQSYKNTQKGMSTKDAIFTALADNPFGAAFLLSTIGMLGAGAFAAGSPLVAIFSAFGLGAGLAGLADFASEIMADDGKGIFQKLGDKLGFHLSYSDQQRLDMILDNLNDEEKVQLLAHPDILKQLAQKNSNMTLDEAKALIQQQEMSENIEQLGATELDAAQQWLNAQEEMRKNLTNQTNQMINAGQVSLDDTANQFAINPIAVQQDLDRIASREIPSTQHDKPQESSYSQYKRKYIETLKELEYVKNTNNLSDTEKQKIIKSLITEQTTNIENEYKYIKNKILISNLNEDKKTEALAKLEEEHLKNVENITNLTNNKITEKEFTEQYSLSKKNLEQLTGLFFTTVSREESLQNINQRYYMDPIKEAQRVLQVSNTLDTTNQTIINNLTEENTNRINKEYQYMQQKIKESSLTDEKKQTALLELEKHYDINRTNSIELQRTLLSTNDITQANFLLEQFNKSYLESKNQISSLTGINYENMPETAEEAEASRNKVSNNMVKAITTEQQKSQELQKITNLAIDDFMDLHTDLMTLLQDSISEDHKNIYDSIGITHKILLDLQQVIARSGAMIAYVLSRAGIGGGGINSGGLTPTGDITTITNQPEIEAKLEAAAKQFNIDPALLKALAQAESTWNQDAISPVGAIGIMQLMPDTAASLGVNPYNIDQNIFGGAKYLRQLLDQFGNNEELAIAAYNAGPDAVKRHGGIPPYGETQNHVTKVLNFRKGYIGREVLPQDNTGNAIGNHPSEIRARQNAEAIAQGQEIQWTNDNERILYDTLSDMNFNSADIAGIMAYVKYANPNFDAILNEEHGGIFALGGSNKEKALQILKESNKDPNNKIAQIVASIRALGIESNNYNNQNESIARVIASRLANTAGWDKTDVKRVMEQAEKYFNKFSNQTAVLGVSERVSGTDMYALNANRQPTPVTRGGAGTGSTLPLRKQTTGVNCTSTSAEMVLTAWTGQNWQQDTLSTGNWATTLDQYADQINFNSPQEFNTFVSSWFDKNPNTPLFLYQTNKDATGHILNAGRGSHATVIAARNTDGTYRIHNPAGGIVQTLRLEDIYDPNAHGGVQEMPTGNAVWAPRNALQVTNFEGQASAVVSRGPSRVNNQFANWTVQDFYNYIIGAPVGFQGTYNIDPYIGIIYLIIY